MSLPYNEVRNSLIGTFSNDVGGYSEISAPVYIRRGIMTAGDGGHYGWPRMPIGQDIGGEFAIQYSEFIPALVPCTIYAIGNYDNVRYHGNMYLGAPDPSGLLPLLDGKDFGPEAYSKMKPTKPAFSGLNSLVELRDLPGMLRQRMSSNGLHDVGNYYLAEEFGWKPLLSDIRKLVQTQREIQRRLKQLLRDNGKPIRRRITIRDESSETDFGPEIGSYGYTAPGLQSNWSTGQIYQTRSVSRDKIWASALFRYWLPPGPKDIKYQRRLIAALYGLKPSPAVLYNAIPWTWLIDWFSNLGSLVDNLDAGVADRLAAERFYIMRERSVGTDYRHAFNAFSANNVDAKIVLRGTAQVRYTSKTRVRGNPFGLAANENSFTAMQLAILAALGLSRS